MKRGLALFLTVVAAGDAAAARPAPRRRAPIASVRLKTISARVHSKGASLVIEATDPVGYVAARPDPLTITLDFRNVSRRGCRQFRRVERARVRLPASPWNRWNRSARPPPACASRCRSRSAHHVRSDRNTS